MNTHQIGATMQTPTILEFDLAGEVTATVITMSDADGTTVAAQLTVPDEPLTPSQLLDLADELRALVRTMSETAA